MFKFSDLFSRKVKVDDSSPMQFPAVDISAIDKKKVLLVDDEEQNAEVIAFFLKRLGFTVTRAATSQEAVRLVEALGPFYIAFVDHNLGSSSRADGIAITPNIRMAGTPFVFGLTGMNSEPVKKEWHRCGALRVLVKPISEEHIKKEISTLE